MSVYLGAAARTEIAAAQLQLDAHLPGCADGRCPACGHIGPCPAYAQALSVLRRYRRLPRRRPGATRPELTGGGGADGWFARP